MISPLRRLQKVTDHFLFSSCDPSMAAVLRIGFAALLLVYVSLLAVDSSKWFSDEGVLKADTAQYLYQYRHWSIFFVLPATPQVVQICFAILLLQSCLLMAGCWSRFQIACVFIWLVSIHHRNPLILDAEDTVFRSLAFLMIFLPLDQAWSIGRVLSRRPSPGNSAETAWAIRLIQVQMAVIYASAAWCKLQGATWRDGSALYYVAQMSDYFGRFGLPESFLNSPWCVRTATWSVLAIEGLLPLALWLRPTRKYAIVAGIGLHLAIEACMDLFLFQWIMILGLLSFVKPDEWSFLKRFLIRFRPVPCSQTPIESKVSC